MTYAVLFNPRIYIKRLKRFFTIDTIKISSFFSYYKKKKTCLFLSPLSTFLSQMVHWMSYGPHPDIHESVGCHFCRFWFRRLLSAVLFGAAVLFCVPFLWACTGADFSVDYFQTISTALHHRSVDLEVVHNSGERLVIQIFSNIYLLTYNGTKLIRRQSCTVCICVSPALLCRVTVNHLN